MTVLRPTRAAALLFATGLLVSCSGTADDGPEGTPATSAEASSPAEDSAGADEAEASTGPGAGSETTEATASGQPAAGAEFEPLDLAVTAPREVVTLEDGTLLISDQIGVVHVVGPDGTARAEPLLDVSGSITTPDRGALESGLAGFALAPDFAETGHVYTTTTHSPSDIEEDLPQGTRSVNILSRWTVDTKTLVADQSSEERLLVLPSIDADHVGGEIVFDDDGLLYTALGAPSRHETAQDPQSYPGSVLRIDPTPAEGEISADRPYGIPEDNPFADGQEGLPEVYSYGYRNPWRLSWDAEHGLLVGEAMSRDKDQQVGQPEPGDNAGYPEVSGSCWEDGEVAQACRETEGGSPIAPPVLEYGPEVGEILSGVVVPPAGDLAGQVIVADWLGRVLVATPGEAPWDFETLTEGSELVGRGGYLWDLDAEADGALYALVAGRSMAPESGAVFRLVPPA